MVFREGLLNPVLIHVPRATASVPSMDDAVLGLRTKAFYREHPDRRRVGAAGVGVEALGAEVERIRQVLTGGGALTDIQLFSQLKACIRTNYSNPPAHGGAIAQRRWL